jgi:hypothetical protein
MSALQRTLGDFADAGQLSLSGSVEDRDVPTREDMAPGPWARDLATHPGEIAAWEYGPERVAVLGVQTDGATIEEYEILIQRSYPGNRRSKTSCLDVVPDEQTAREIAHEYMAE